MDNFYHNTVTHINSTCGPYRDQLPTLFNWRFDTSLAAERTGITFNPNASDLENTLHLRQSLKQRLTEQPDFNDHYNLAEFFVVHWGGVKGNKKLKQVLAPFSNNSALKTTKGISTISKYLSIRYADCFIYDSRVAFALNVINWLHGNCDQFFPIPQGRSTKVYFFDIETLFNIEVAKQHHIDFQAHNFYSQHKKLHHVPDNLCYSRYCGILKEASGLSDMSALEYEILLFSMTDILLEKLYHRFN